MNFIQFSAQRDFKQWKLCGKLDLRQINYFMLSINLRIDVAQVVSRQFHNSIAADDPDECCDSIVLRQQVLQEGPHENRSEAEEDTTGDTEIDLIVRNLT